MLMRQPGPAHFLLRAAKTFRKYWAGLTIVTQDAQDLLDSDTGRAVIHNSATQVLLRQSPQAIARVAEVFDLSDGERDFLQRAERGQGLLCAGVHRVGFHLVASRIEDDLIRTDPAYLTQLAQQSEPDIIELSPVDTDGWRR
jgi:hypothetical protein